MHSADGWHAVLEPVIARYRGTVKRLYFRGDAAFANPEIYEFIGAACRSAGRIAEAEASTRTSQRLKSRLTALNSEYL